MLKFFGKLSDLLSHSSLVNSTRIIQHAHSHMQLLTLLPWLYWHLSSCWTILALQIDARIVTRRLQHLRCVKSFSSRCRDLCHVEWVSCQAVASWLVGRLIHLESMLALYLQFLLWYCDMSTEAFICALTNILPGWTSLYPWHFFDLGFRTTAPQAHLQAQMS